MTRYFEYGPTETQYLCAKDKRLAQVIERIGHIDREVHTDLFASVVHSIVGQQISSQAQKTVWGRLLDALGTVDARTVAAADTEKLRSFGMSFRKAEYIADFAHRVEAGEFDLEAVSRMPDAQAIQALASLRGIGVWTAEMILLFCLQRPDIFSYDDLAIVRGVRMVYRHRSVPRKLFEKYRRRFSPCGSVASLYFWAVAGGALPDLRDPAQK